LERPRGPLPTRVQGTDPLPDTYASTLETGLSTLGIELSAGAREAIDGHVRLLLAWNRAINLTAIRDPAAAATLHVLDSLSAVPLLRSAGIQRLLDLGSGGGFPGIPLAAALPAEALLVESIGKKAVFLRTAVDGLELPARVDVAAERAETLAGDPAHRERWPAVVARAVAALPELAELALPLVAVDGLLVAWKREPLDDEVDAARAIVGQLGGDRPEVLDVGLPGLVDHRLVVIRKRWPTPDRYPRSAADRKRTARARERVRSPAPGSPASSHARGIA
jgi:16S rRNA (guanine527-N7)-methyltransferase